MNIKHPVLEVFEVGEPMRSLFQPQFTMFRDEDITRADHSWNLFHIKLTAKAPDAYEKRGVIELECVNTMHMDEIDNHEMIVRAMRSMLHNLVLHEVDESILICGTRKFDPHKREGYAPSSS